MASQPEKKPRNTTAACAIIAGGGWLPMALATAAVKTRPVVMIDFAGQPQPTELPEDNVDDDQRRRFHHHTVALGQVGKVMEIMHKHGVAEVVLAGNIHKPSLFDLKPDLAGMQLMAHLGTHRHDDHLLRSVAGFLENKGFHVVGAEALLPEILMAEGVLGKVKPGKQAQEDIRLGAEVAMHLGELGVGQAAIVKNGVVLGVEAIEGTAALIERCAGLRGAKGTGGVLVKIMKPGQDSRFDRPSIGPETILQLAEHAYEGVALQAGQGLLLDGEATRTLADKTGVFICGFQAE